MFEVRQLDCYKYDGEWTQNTSYDFGVLETNAQNEKQAFTRFLKVNHGIVFKKNRTLIENDGNCLTIIDRKSKEPLFIAIPMTI